MEKENHKNKKKRGVTYVRVSTDDQAENGASLDVQEELCVKKLKGEYEIVDKLRDEGKSGKDLKRTGIQRVMTLAKDGEIDAVCALSSDRISRNTMDYLILMDLLQKHNVEVIYIHQQKQDDSASSKIVNTVISAVNQFQIDSTSEKVKATQEAKLNLGIFPSMPPIGYTNIENKDAGSRLEQKVIGIDPIRGPLLTETFRLYSTGNYNAYQLCDLMYQRGLTNRKDNQISYSRFYALLRNRFYLGEIHWNDRVIKNARHTPLIDESTFNAVQNILDSQNHHASRQRKHEFLLRGFLRCPRHNKRITAEWHLNKKLAYYHCPNRTGCGKYAESTKLEGVIAEKFKELEFNPDFINRIIEEAKRIFYDRKKHYHSKRQGLVNKQTALRKELETAEGKLMKQILDDESFVRIRDKVRVELKNLDERLYELEDQHDVDVDVTKEILSFTQDIYKTYQKAPFHTKRCILGFFWESFELDDGVIIKSTPTLLFRELLTAEQLFVRSQQPQKVQGIKQKSPFIITNTRLRRQGSNLRPSPYTLSPIARSVDYIIIPMGCEALPPINGVLPFGIVSTPFRQLADLARDCPRGVSPNSPRFSVHITVKSCNSLQGVALPLSYAGIFLLRQAQS